MSNNIVPRYLLYQNSIDTLVPFRDHPSIKDCFRRKKAYGVITISRTLYRFDGKNMAFRVVIEKMDMEKTYA